MAVLRRTAETTRSLPLWDAAKRTLSMVAASGTGCKTAAAARRVSRRPHPAVCRFHGGVLFHNAQEFPESPRADLAKWRLAECLLHRAAAPLRNELWDVQEGGTRRAILDIYASSDAEPSEPVWAWGGCGRAN